MLPDNTQSSHLMPLQPFPRNDTASIALIVLAFNHARYLPQLFASIRANLDDIDELVLIDNGSSDSTASLMRDFGESLPARVSLTIQQNPPRHGVTRAVNIGLRATRAEFIAVTSGDDFLLPERFVAQRRALQANPTLEFCYSNGYVCDEQGLVSQIAVHSGSTLALLKSRPESIAPALYYPVPTIFTQCGLFRRSALLAVGGWDEDLVIDDWPLNIKLFSKFASNYCYVDAYVAAYRRHDSNASKRRFRQYFGQRQVFAKYAHGTDLRRGMSALFAAQWLASVKRRQWHRAQVFFRAALRQKPGLAFIVRWISNEARRRLSINKIR